VGVAVLGTLGTVSESVVLSATLATLALLSITILRDRLADEKTNNALQRLWDHAQSGNSALDFFGEWDDNLFRQSVETAKQLSILAVTNTGFISSHEEHFREMVKKGGKIRYMIVNPLGNAYPLAADQSVGIDRNVGTLRLNTNTSLERMGDLALEFPGSIEIKLLDHLPHVVISMLDPESRTGIIFATLPGFNQPYISRPSFVLYKKRDSHWFNFYQTYFDNLWQSSRAELYDSSKHLLSSTAPVHKP